MGIHGTQTLSPALSWQARRVLDHFGAPLNSLPIGIDHGAFKGDSDRIAIVGFWEYQHPTLKGFAHIVEIDIKTFML